MSLHVENVLSQGSTKYNFVAPIEKVCLMDFAHQVLELVKSFVFGCNIDIALETHHLPHSAELASSTLKHIVLNFCSNAIKFQASQNRDGNGSIVVLFEWDAKKQLLTCSVKDRGPGVRQLFVPYLFQPYKRDTHHVNASGTGIGLSISYKLAKAARGSMGYRDRNGGGAVFYVNLPAKVLEDSTPIVAQPLNNNSSDHSLLSLSPVVPSVQHCLIVDDSKVNLMVLRGLLSRAKLKSDITMATSGPEALRFLLSHCHDQQHSLLLFIDLSMPMLTGHQTVSYWRQMEREMNLTPAYIVAVSASLPKELQVGFDAMLEKPVQLDKLERILSAIQQQHL